MSRTEFDNPLVLFIHCLVYCCWAKSFYCIFFSFVFILFFIFWLHFFLFCYFSVSFLADIFFILRFFMFCYLLRCWCSLYLDRFCRSLLSIQTVFLNVPWHAFGRSFLTYWITYRTEILNFNFLLFLCSMILICHARLWWGGTRYLQRSTRRRFDLPRSCHTAWSRLGFAVFIIFHIRLWPVLLQYMLSP